MDNTFNTVAAQSGAVKAMAPLSGNQDLVMSFSRLQKQDMAPLLCSEGSNYVGGFTGPGNIVIGYLPVYNYFRFLVMSLTGGKDPSRSKSWVQDLLKKAPELRDNLQYLYQWNETVRHSSYKTSNEVFFVIKSLVNDLNIDTVKMVPQMEEYRETLPLNKAGTLKVLDYYLDMTKSAKTTDSDRYYTFLLDMIQAGDQDAACLVTHPALYAMVNVMAEVDGKLLPKAVMGELFQQGITPQNTGLDHFYAITTGYFLRTYLCQIKFCDRQMSAGEYYRFVFGAAAEMSPQIKNAFRMGYALGLKEYKTFQQEITPEVARLIKKRVDLIVNGDTETRRKVEKETQRKLAMFDAPAPEDDGKVYEGVFKVRNFGVARAVPWDYGEGEQIENAIKNMNKIAKMCGVKLNINKDDLDGGGEFAVERSDGTVVQGCFGQLFACVDGEAVIIPYNMIDQDIVINPAKGRSSKLRVGVFRYASSKNKEDMGNIEMGTMGYLGCVVNGGRTPRVGAVQCCPGLTGDFIVDWAGDDYEDIGDVATVGKWVVNTFEDSNTYNKMLSEFKYFMLDDVTFRTLFEPVSTQRMYIESASEGSNTKERKTAPQPAPQPAAPQPAPQPTPQPSAPKKPMFSWNAGSAPAPDPNKSTGENLKAAFSWGGKTSGGAGIPSLGDLAGAGKPAAKPKDDPNDPGTPKTIDQYGGAKAEKRTLNLHAHQWTGSNEAEIAAFTGGNASKNPDGSLTVQTTEGSLNYPQNAWVVRDVVGEYYAVKDEKFKSIYSHVSGDVYACKGGNRVDFIQWTGSNQDAVRKFCPGAQFLGSVVGVAASWDPSQMLTGNSGCWIACYDRSKNDYAIVQNNVFRKSYKFV